MARNSANEKEYRSSAWALLIVGGVGLVIVILGITGVLPLQLSNPYLFYGVTMAIFILFLVMGVLSMKSARIFAQKARVENTLLETVETWCLENLKAEEIDCALETAAQTGGETPADAVSEYASQAEVLERGALQDEVSGSAASECGALQNEVSGSVVSDCEALENEAQLQYFRRVDYLRERINRQFLNLDQGLVDQFIDEKLYDRIFGEKS